MKYRIMENGYNYRIQRKIGWFKWEWVIQDDIFRPGPIEFKTLEDAESYIDKLKIQEAPYRVVVNVRETPLWNALLENENRDD